MTRISEKLNNYSYVLAMVLLCSALFVSLPGSLDKFGIGRYAVLIIFLVVSTITTIFLTLANFRQKLLLSRASLLLTITLVLLLLISIIGFIKSSNSINSYWGDSSNISNAFWPVLLSLVAGVMILLNTTAEKLIVKLSLSALLISVSIKSLVYLAIYMFTSNGLASLMTIFDYQSHTTFALVAVLAGFGLAGRSKLLNVLSGAVTVVNLGFLVIATPQLSPVALLVAGCIAAATTLNTSRRLTAAHALLLVGIVLAILAKMFIAGIDTNNLLPKSIDPLSAVVSSINAVSSNSEALLLGKGLSNFASEFNRARPAALNLSQDWQEVYNTPTSELSRSIIEQGVLYTLLFSCLLVYAGLVAYRAAHRSTESNALHVRSDVMGEGFNSAASFAVFGFVLAYLFSSWDISVFLWFSVFAGIVAAADRHSLYLPSWQGLLSTVVPVLVVGAIVLAKLVPSDPISQIYTYINADQQFQQGLNEIQNNNARNAYDHIAEARRLLPDKAKYRERFALLSLAIGESVLTATNGAESNVEQLFAQSISEIKIVTEQLAPDSIPYWLSRINIYSSLENKYANSINQAINSYDRLIALSPTQPLFRLQQGIKLHDAQEEVRAAQRFSEAIALKPDYYQAYLARAQSYKAQGKLEEARQDLVLISQKVAISDPVYQQAAQELKKLFGE